VSFAEASPAYEIIHLVECPGGKNEKLIEIFIAAREHCSFMESR
jgi:hypothetical protein